MYLYTYNTQSISFNNTISVDKCYASNFTDKNKSHKDYIAPIRPHS